MSQIWSESQSSYWWGMSSFQKVIWLIWLIWRLLGWLHWFVEAYEKGLDGKLLFEHQRHHMPAREDILDDYNKGNDNQNLFTYLNNIYNPLLWRNKANEWQRRLWRDCYDSCHSGCHIMWCCQKWMRHTLQEWPSVAMHLVTWWPICLAWLLQ